MVENNTILKFISPIYDCIVIGVAFHLRIKSIDVTNHVTGNCATDEI